VRRYLRHELCYRDVEELPAERAVEVDHVMISWWVQTFAPQFSALARPARRAGGDRWFVSIPVMGANYRRIGSRTRTAPADG